MPKPFLLVLAGSLIVFAPSPNFARGQNSPQPTPAQVQPAQAQPAQAQPAAVTPGTPGQAMAPVQTIPTAPATYPKNPVKPTAESLTKARNLYAIDCAMCHGDNGNGKTDLATSMQLTLSDWTDAKSLASFPDGQLFLVIRNGKDKMPSEETGRASDDQVWNLIFYIRGFSKTAATTASSAQN